MEHITFAEQGKDVRIKWPMKCLSPSMHSGLSTSENHQHTEVDLCGAHQPQLWKLLIHLVKKIICTYTSHACSSTPHLFQYCFAIIPNKIAALI